MKANTYLFGLFCFLFFGLTALVAQPALYFNIENERTVTHPTLGNAYAFDISMFASYSGTYHSRGLLYLQYDTAKFGASVDLRNNIAYEHGELLQGSVNFLGQIRPKYLTVNVIDNRDSVVAFTWESQWLGFLPNVALHNEVADTLKKLYTIYLKIVNPPAQGDVGVFLPLMANQQFLITDVDGDGAPDEIPYGTIGVFPIELMDFYASWNEDESVKLSWATLTETNNDYFVIEKRHENGTFFPIGEVDGAGNSDEVRMYQWIDRSEHSYRNYYRLRQVDIDGNSTYSKLIQLSINRAIPIQVFPSPTQGNIFFQSKITGPQKVFISDINGKLLQEKTIHFTTTDTSLKVDLTPYSDGFYFIQIIDEHGKSQSHKIIKSQH